MTKVEQLTELMRTQVVDFMFEKVDGTVRFATGTLMPEAIESFVGPSTGTSNKAPNPEVVVYFDVGAQAFRSFKKEKYLGLVEE